MIKIIFSIFKSFFLVLLFLPLILFFILIYFILLFSNNGNPLFWSKRIGLNNQTFLMPKFRSMKINTPHVASHILENSNIYITKIGKILRKTSLDEIPQIFSILKGDMSLVGPRPALYNQVDLIKLRSSKNIHTLKPGLTGLAQINGRDDLSIEKKVEFDLIYLKNKSFFYDIKIIIKTFFKVLNIKNISH